MLEVPKRCGEVDEVVLSQPEFLNSSPEYEKNS